MSTLPPASGNAEGKKYRYDSPYLSDPSLNLLPQFHGTMVPSFSFCISTTGFRMPGTAADAKSALQMIVSGAVM